MSRHSDRSCRQSGQEEHIFYPHENVLAGTWRSVGRWGRWRRATVGFQQRRGELKIEHDTGHMEQDSEVDDGRSLLKTTNLATAVLGQRWGSQARFRRRIVTWNLAFYDENLVTKFKNVVNGKPSVTVLMVPSWNLHGGRLVKFLWRYENYRRRFNLIKRYSKKSECTKCIVGDSGERPAVVIKKKSAAKCGDPNLHTESSLYFKLIPWSVASLHSSELMNITSI